MVDTCFCVQLIVTSVSPIVMPVNFYFAVSVEVIITDFAWPPRSGRQKLSEQGGSAVDARLVKSAGEQALFRCKLWTILVDIHRIFLIEIWGLSG